MRIVRLPTVRLPIGVLIAALAPLACHAGPPGRLVTSAGASARAGITLTLRLGAPYRLAYVPVTDWEVAEATLTPEGGVAETRRVDATVEAATNARRAELSFPGLTAGTYRLEVRLLRREPDGTEQAQATVVRDPLSIASATTLDLGAEFAAQLRAQPAIAAMAAPAEVGAWPPDGPPARFNNPRGVAVGADGTVYVADTENHQIRRIVVDADGVPRVYRVVGGGVSAAITEGAGHGALVGRPHGVTVGPDGALYLAAHGHLTRVALDGDGVGTLKIVAGGYPAGFADGVGGDARLNQPVGVAFDGQGRAIVADYYNHRVRRVTIGADGVGTVETIAGTGAAGSADGAGAVATFREPTGVAMDSVGRVYVADYANNRVRRLVPDGNGGFNVETVATGVSGAYAVARQSDGRLFVAARNAGRIVRLDVDGAGAVTATTIANPVSLPQGVAVAADGTVYVGEVGGDLVSRLVDDGAGGYTRSVYAGGSPQGFMEGSVGLPQFASPEALAYAGPDRFYVADTGNHRVRRMTRVTDARWRYETIAGTGVAGGADGAGAAATLSSPAALAVAADGTTYVADAGGHRVRRLTFDAGGAATVATVAGTGVAGGADGAGAGATFNGPRGLALATDGTLYVADAGGHRIRRLTFDAGGAASVATVAGAGTAGYAGGAARTARFSTPSGLAVDPQGKLYVADTGNHWCRRLTP